MTAYTELQNSTYLDYDSYRSTAPAPSGGSAVESFTINVALVLDRAHDPASLLHADWASRQQQLDTLDKNQTLWSTYGADAGHYKQVMTDLATLGIQTVDQVDANNGYVSSVESRTIWVQLNDDNFTTLFGPGATLLEGKDQSDDTIWYWQGNLSLPEGWTANLGVKGLWFDSTDFRVLLSDPGGGTAAPLKQGPQSVGNSVTQADKEHLYPNDIAQSYYDFPLSGALRESVATGTIGLVEPGVGSAVPSGTFQHLLDEYRARTGITTPGVYATVDGGGQDANSGNAGERSLDVGVVTATNPQSTLVLYAGSGHRAQAQSDAFTAYQSAIWDDTNDPQVIASSYRFAAAQPAPGSPFWWTAKELFIDGALANVTVVSSAGDGGSGDLVGNGVTNVSISRASPYGLIVGGASLSTLSAAESDTTLSSLVAKAMQSDPDTLWRLMAGGLTELPATATAADWLVQTAWNEYALTGTSIDPGYTGNWTGVGGVDSSQPAPWYQHAFGLAPVTSDPAALPGRGVPDVAALSGGNMDYIVPQADMRGTDFSFGTSAAAPLWAALISQFNAIFADQNLPPLGYMNDLLYIAAAIAPAAFDDITMGHNTSSFTLGGTYATGGEQITPTGYGYEAKEGYDLVSGLGTPNGVLLARTLTAIGHAQTSYESGPAVLDLGPIPVSGADQSLMFQATSRAGAEVTLVIGSQPSSFSSGESAAHAWTAQLAEQVLQADFDAALVTLFDRQAQAATVQASLSAGASLAVLIDSVAGETRQGTLTTDFGFVDFAAATDTVRVARPLAVAQTVDGLDDQTAIVRLRQNGTDSVSLSFYRVDDLTGAIGGLLPRDPGYAAAAQARAYQTGSGTTSISGPGYGSFGQTTLLDVDSGDLVAMTLSNLSTGDTYWAFAQANEKVAGQSIGHLWNYGLNTWGWEDRFGGGDRDFNDLVVGVDFTSAYGSGWLT